MKTTSAAFALLLAVMLTYTVLAQNPGDSIFAGIQVHTVNIRFPQPQYWDSLTIYYNQGKEQYIAATVIVNGVRYDSVGVRFKGNSSYSHPNNKKSFRLSFDEYRSDQRWDGVKGIHLDNCWGDPTLMREKIHLDFCRDAGISAPRANFSRLYLNDTLFAFYSLIEHVDKRFLSSRYGNTKGDLFKAVDGIGGGGGAIGGGGGGGGQVLSDFRWLGSDTSLYLSRYELKTEESQIGWSKLVRSIDTLNNSSNPAASLPTQVNLSALYKAFATDILFGNLDAYISSGRNFYFYILPTTGKLEWIVWDVGLSFGLYGAMGGGAQSSIENLSVTYVSSATERPLFGKILNTPTLKNEYLRTFSTLFNSYFSPARLFPVIDSIANLVRPFVYEDTRKTYTNQEFETNIASDLTEAGGGLGGGGVPRDSTRVGFPGDSTRVGVPGGGGSRKPGLKSFISARHANVQSQLAAFGITSTEKTEEVPTSYGLEQNYPNPFNPRTTIRYQLPARGHVSLRVYDMMGREVAVLADAEQEGGHRSVVFDASNLPSGVYFYRLIVGSFVETKKLVVLR